MKKTSSSFVWDGWKNLNRHYKTKAQSQTNDIEKIFNPSFSNICSSVLSSHLKLITFIFKAYKWHKHMQTKYAGKGTCDAMKSRFCSQTGAIAMDDWTTMQFLGYIQEWFIFSEIFTCYKCYFRTNFRRIRLYWSKFQWELILSRW